MRWIPNVGWMSGDLDDLARDDERDGAADMAYHRWQQERDEAHLRARRFERRADMARRMVTNHLTSETMLDFSLAQAKRWARVAVRLEEWAKQAGEKSRG